MLNDPDSEKSKRVMEAMLKMKKIDYFIITGALQDIKCAEPRIMQALDLYHRLRRRAAQLRVVAHPPI